MVALVSRAVRGVKILARDRKIPRLLRWLAVFGLLPVPGPFDEAVLLLVAGLLFTFYPDRMREAWRVAGAARVSEPTIRPGSATGSS
jgi:hypothetical protein